MPRSYAVYPASDEGDFSKETRVTLSKTNSRKTDAKPVPGHYVAVAPPSNKEQTQIEGEENQTARL